MATAKAIMDGILRICVGKDVLGLAKDHEHYITISEREALTGRA